jgi:hypothetical protein
MRDIGRVDELGFDGSLRDGFSPLAKFRSLPLSQIRVRGVLNRKLFPF